MGTIYAQEKTEDGFMYIELFQESTFGWIAYYPLPTTISQIFTGNNVSVRPRASNRVSRVIHIGRFETQGIWLFQSHWTLSNCL
jgi:hypothetical protein